MNKNYRWTRSGARLQLIKSNPGKLNWLFLPGGPGLGSESLKDLTDCLGLPGSLWHLDLPGDGSNQHAFSEWQQGLIEAVDTLDHVILVGHSTGGMFALATPELESKLEGLVLMDSAPDASWQKNLDKMIDLESLAVIHRQNPCNATLKDLTIAAAPYLFTQKGLEKGIALLQRLPYNYESCKWAEENFDPHYKALWIPKTIPALIFSGSEDFMTPLSLFSNLSAFNRDNIMLREIRNAGHFPWIENPEEVQIIFQEFLTRHPI